MMHRRKNLHYIEPKFDSGYSGGHLSCSDMPEGQEVRGLYLELFKSQAILNINNEIGKTPP